MEKYKIAIVDDENEILSMLERYLSRKEEYSVTTFNNPLNALSHVNDKTDLVLLDIMMPQMNGLDVLPKLFEKNKNIKVIMMTAYSTLDKVLNAHRSGATHYIMKPFGSLDAVDKKIKEALQES